MGRDGEGPMEWVEIYFDFDIMDRSGGGMSGEVADDMSDDEAFHKLEAPATLTVTGSPIPLSTAIPLAVGWTWRKKYHSVLI